MAPSRRAGYENHEWSASGTYESAKSKTIELKAFQIKEIHAPAKLIRVERVQRPSDRTGASLVFSSCIECIGSARKRPHSLCKNLTLNLCSELVHNAVEFAYHCRRLL